MVLEGGGSVQRGRAPAMWRLSRPGVLRERGFPGEHSVETMGRMLHDAREKEIALVWYGMPCMMVVMFGG